MTGQLTIWLTINDCLTVTIDGSKRTNNITSLHSQKHHGLTDGRPITSRLNVILVLPPEICIILHILRKPNSTIAFLFIQNTIPSLKTS